MHRRGKDPFVLPWKHRLHTFRHVGLSLELQQARFLAGNQNTHIGKLSRLRIRQELQKGVIADGLGGFHGSFQNVSGLVKGRPSMQNMQPMSIRADLRQNRLAKMPLLSQTEVMGLTITALGIYQTGKLALPLLGAGYKMIRAQLADSKEPGEVESAIQEILGERIKTLVDGKIATLSEKQLEATDDALVRFTGLVLQSLVEEALTQPEFAEVKDKLAAGLPELPRCWGLFVGQGIPGMQPLVETDFLLALQAAHEGSEKSPTVDPALLSSFFVQWFQHGVSDVLWKQGWQQKLADAVCPWLASALSSTLITDHPVALTAFRESMLLFQKEHSVKLGTIDKRTHEIAKKQKSEGRKSTRRHKELKSGISKVEAMLVEQTAPGRLAAYKRSLLAAFRPYQELAIDNFAAADQTCPDIWDIFVHPACAENHLRPEEMDAAQMEKPPRLPAADLLPLLALDDHRRTVLLGDPGMGKSTLIQALIAHLASGRPLSGAPALTGLLPVPLILRDLVPLLPQDQVEGWTWDSLLTVLIDHYQREETAPLLCDAFKDHRDEFRQFIQTDAKVFFLIDGLDEIGDLTKRRKIVECIQDGIRAVNKETRWLITSRVIGYESAPADAVVTEFESLCEIQEGNDFSHMEKEIHSRPDCLKFESDWKPYQHSTAELGPIGYTRLYTKSASSLGTGSAKAYFSIQVYIAPIFYLAPFDDQRQDWFTQRWFQHRHSTDYSKELMREVRAHHHDGVRIISRVPNLLCMMNVLKRSGKPLPDGRAALYDEIVKAYLGGIDSAYRLRPVLGNTCPFDAQLRRLLLSLLGAHMQQRRVVGKEKRRAKSKKAQTGEKQESEGTILISKEEIATLLVPAIKRMVADKRVQSAHGAEALLDELLHHIASRSGLLIPRSSDEQGQTLFGFTHLSFLEFFTAEWLGMEFDRRQRQLARQTEAMQDGMTFTPFQLEILFPPFGPITHNRTGFPALAATPGWHEPLIFLLETRKDDTPTLLRWLFPLLHGMAQRVQTKNREPGADNRNPESPLLPLDAVRLVVKLANDLEIPVPAATRQSWWRILWSAYLEWPHPPWVFDESKRWPIAPLLLGNAALRREVLQALAAVQPQHLDRPLYLFQCHQLTSVDLILLSGLDRLKTFYLNGCTGLEDTTVLAGLHQIQRLYLVNCTGLKDGSAFQGLARLEGLQELSLAGCTGLNDETLRELREKLPASCQVWGSDGRQVG